MLAEQNQKYSGLVLASMSSVTWESSPQTITVEHYIVTEVTNVLPKVEIFPHILHFIRTTKKFEHQISLSELSSKCPLAYNFVLRRTVETESSVCDINDTDAHNSAEAGIHYARPFPSYRAARACAAARQAAAWHSPVGILFRLGY
ncbi:hypothetical protein EVAR_54750_1 [Eumeta japonica]|uniref:Uncharacterized protein n=1 Tax=Eumeta variegata TaxID=151549 RepID=A0A4C1YZI0_EUMVA|nr:hypothetical protein EVAR_54750_1 [Eumeta japonica]